jgi:hypothetical protein
MFGRAYLFMMNGKVFGQIADSVIYLHAVDEDEAWKRVRRRT